MNVLPLSSASHAPMKKNNTILIALWSAAAGSMIIGLLLTTYTLGGIGRTKEIWRKKTSDLQDMAAMRATADTHREILKHYAQYPGTPVQLEVLARTAAPGLNLIIRSTETHPSVPGWTARKVSVGITNISGEELGRFLQALRGTTPPWAALNCTLTASPTLGQLAKAELVLETVERIQ